MISTGGKANFTCPCCDCSFVEEWSSLNSYVVKFHMIECVHCGEPLGVSKKYIGILALALVTAPVGIILLLIFHKKINLLAHVST